MTSISTSFFVSSTDVLIDIDENVVVLIPLLACLVGEDRNIDFIEDSVIASD